MRQSGTRPMTQIGFSIVELMVAMVVSLILLAGVLQVFYSSKSTYLVNEQLARLQENGRIAIEMIQRDIREAGYLGCAKQVPFSNTLATPTALQWDFAVPLQGFEADGAATWLPALDTTIVVSPRDDNDVLALRLPVRGGQVIPIAAPGMANSTDALPTTPVAPAPFAAGDIVMLSDCNASAVFEVTGYDGVTGAVSHDLGGPAPGNASADVGYAFQAAATVQAVETVIYYVRDSATGTPSLWRRAGRAAPEEIVEGVESLQVLYGEDTTADRLVDAYVTADAVANWQNVLSINVGLLVHTPDESGVAVDNNNYAVLDTNFGPAGDRRQRMVFTTTAALRNRTI